MFVKQTKKANVAVLPRWMQNKKRQAVIGYRLLQHLYRDVSWLALSLTSAFSDFSNGLGFTEFGSALRLQWPHRS